MAISHRSPGSLCTLGSVLAFGELVEMAVSIGNQDSARKLLPVAPAIVTYTQTHREKERERERERVTLDPKP